MSDDAHQDAPQDTPPLTRRELRERERAAEAAAVAPDIASAGVVGAAQNAEADDENDGIDDLVPAAPAAAAPTAAPPAPAPLVEPASTPSDVPAPVPAPLPAEASTPAPSPAAAPVLPPAAEPQPQPLSAPTPASDTTTDPADPAVAEPAVAASANAVKRTRKGGFWRALFTGIGFGLLALIVGIAAVTVIVPRAFGATPLTVLTGSMEPTLPPGTLVITRPRPIDQIRIGDIVTYEPNANDTHELVTHRVTAITTSTDGSTVFTVQGDANNAPDAPVHSKQIVGVLWYSVPWFGWVNNFLGGLGWASLILPGLATLLIAYALYAIISSGVSSRKKKAAAAEKAATDSAATGEGSAK